MIFSPNLSEDQKTAPNIIYRSYADQSQIIGGSFFVNLTRPCNKPSQILMKLRGIIELVILNKMILISTNSVQEVKSYGPSKIAMFVFTQALKLIEILTVIFKMFIN